AAWRALVTGVRAGAGDREHVAVRREPALAAVRALEDRVHRAPGPGREELAVPRRAARGSADRVAGRRRRAREGALGGVARRPGARPGEVPVERGRHTHVRRAERDRDTLREVEPVRLA